MYGKYFSSTFTGSMVGAGGTVFAIWGYVIANCRKGIIEMNPAILSTIIGDDITKIHSAINYLCQPDPLSRSLEHDGRRLIYEGAFLYHVPNHETYRKILNEDERREYFRIKKQEERQKKSALTVDCQRQSKTVKDMSTVSTQAEAEAEAKDSSNEESCAKPLAAPRHRSAQQEKTASPVIVQVPCIGGTWNMTQAKHDEWKQTFLGIDLDPELRKAIQWLKDNPARIKTARGMPAYFGRWLSNAQNRTSKGGKYEQPRTPAHRMLVDGEYQRQLAVRKKKPAPEPLGDEADVLFSMPETI